MQLHRLKCLNSLIVLKHVTKKVPLSYSAFCDPKLCCWYVHTDDRLRLILARYIHVTSQYRQVREHDEKQVVEQQTSKGQVTLGTKVVEAGKDATYLGFVILAIGIGVSIFYVIGKELFSSETPQGVYTTALKRCKNNTEVCDELGDPIKGRGEMTKRGRARHPSHVLFEKDGVQHMRMQFYLIGSIRSGTAQVEVRKNESGKWECRYLFVTVDTYPYKTIVIEDNR